MHFYPFGLRNHLLCFPQKNVMQLDTEREVYNYIMKKIDTTVNNVLKVQL